MKTNLKNKGFTLIELLAVIVVLAIIMMIATTQVIPLITSSREGGFASTANTFVSTVETLVLADEIAGSASATEGLCYSISDLVDAGYLGSITSGQYEGVVLVDKSVTNGGAYEYTLYLFDTSNSYYFTAYSYLNGSVTADSIVYTGTSTDYACSTYSASYKAVTKATTTTTTT